MGDFPHAAAVDLHGIRARDASMTQDSPLISVTDRLPPALKLVTVICPFLRCLAYIDAEKVWRYASDNQEIKGVFAWQEFP